MSDRKAAGVFTVGENGPETLVMGGGATGTVIPIGIGMRIHLHDSRMDVKAEMEKLAKVIYDPANEARYRTFLQEKLTSATVRQGLHSKDASVRHATRDLVAWIKRKLAEL